MANANLKKEFAEFEKKVNAVFIEEAMTAREQIQRKEIASLRNHLINAVGTFESIHFNGTNGDEIVKTQKLITAYQDISPRNQWTMDVIGEVASEHGVTLEPDQLIALFIAARGSMVMENLQVQQTALYEHVTGKA